MIPENPEDLHVLAGEYVLGVLDEPDATEVAEALTTNIELRRAVTFWEEQLNPLSELASPALPPPGTWEAIEARITKPTSKPTAPPFWERVALWRWSTAGLAAAAAALALWIATTPAPGPRFVAILHAPQLGRDRRPLGPSGARGSYGHAAQRPCIRALGHCARYDKTTITGRHPAGRRTQARHGAARSERRGNAGDQCRASWRLSDAAADGASGFRRSCDSGVRQFPWNDDVRPARRTSLSTTMERAPREVFGFDKFRASNSRSSRR
jgi:hypothetical protein